MKTSDTPDVNRYDSPTADDNLGRAIGDPRPASPDGRPRGFTVGHAVGDPPPASLDGRPHGFTVGHAVGDPPPASLDRRPHGFTVGHGVGDPPPASLDGRPHGFTVGHAIRPRSTTPAELRPVSRAPDDQANTRTREPRPAPAKRAA
jgi:hypothetical protein